MRRTMGWLGGIGLLALALLAGYVLVARRWHLGWGASEDECRAVMPGDELVAHPSLVATRAMTIDAPPAAVWPWLVQMGYRRAGWYSYDRFDNEGRVVRRIIPEPRRDDDPGPPDAVRDPISAGDHLQTTSFQAGLLDRLVPRLNLFGEDGADLGTLRRRIERTAPPMVPWARVRVEPVLAGGVAGEWVIPKDAAEDRVALYLHGGAWVMGSPRTHRALVADLARRAGVRALSIDYRLAPEHPYPAALDDAVAGYEWLLASGIEPGRIVVAGDSAGGNLALALLLRLRDAGTPLPAGAVLLSPVTDLELGGASHASRKSIDPFFARADLRTFIAPYAGTHDRREPYLSPLWADLRGLPPLLVHVGDHEVLLDDAVRLGERAHAAGVEARTVVWPGMTHVFQMQTFLLPEARRANAEIGAFIRSRVGLAA